MTVTEYLGSFFSFWLNFSRICICTYWSGTYQYNIWRSWVITVIMLSYSLLEIVVYSNLIMHTVKWLHATIQRGFPSGSWFLRSKLPILPLCQVDCWLLSTGTTQTVSACPWFEYIIGIRISYRSTTIHLYCFCRVLWHHKTSSSSMIAVTCGLESMSLMTNRGTSTSCGRLRLNGTDSSPLSTKEITRN